MNLRGLDLNLLVALDVLLDERNVTRAAQRLNLSQSGMSTALLRLREFFADELLIAMGRRQMVLTPLAQTLVAPAREIVLRALTLIDSTPDFNPAVAKRTFTIMASDYTATLFLPKIAQRLSREAPGITLEVVSFGADLQDKLERGEIDFLIMPDHYLSRAQPSARLFEEHYVCISWNENSFLKDGLNADAYWDLGHIVLRIEPGVGGALDEWFAERFDRPHRIEGMVMNFAMLPFYVVGTQRLATVHRRFAEHYAQYLPIKIHPLPFEIPTFIEMLQWNRVNDRHPAFLWLQGIFQDEAKTMTD